MTVTHDEYRRRRWTAARARMRSTILWTLLGLALAVPLCAYAASPRGLAWTIGGGLIGAVLILGFAALFAWQAAGRRASSLIMGEWAAANGWGHWSRDADGEGTGEPFPEATPLLRLGDRRYVTDVLTGTVDGASVRIANHCFEDDSYDGKGRRTTTYTYHLVALLEYPVAISPMRMVRRSGLGRMLKGADDATAGWGAMRVEDLENDLFRERFSVRVADDADPVQVFAVFDPQVQEDLAEGRAIPAVDLVEAEGPWLMLASKGALDGDELDRVEGMIGSVRWAMATLGSHSPPSG